MDTSPVRLQTTYRSSFSQNLQLVRCYDSSPGDPTTAAHLSLLFEHLELQSSLSHLHTWLAHYVGLYVAQHPRNQTDLAEKVLAAAIYLNISDRYKLDFEVPERRLIDYIEYAAEQSWLNDPFLAYYCARLASSVTACEGTHTYFADNYDLFVDRRNIQAVSQALIILGDTLGPEKRACGYNELTTVRTDDHYGIRYPAWVLASMATGGASTAQLASRPRFVAYLDRQLTEHATMLAKQAVLPSLLALVWEAEGLVDLQSYLEHNAPSQETKTYTAEVDDAGHLRLDIDLTTFIEQSLLAPVADVALALTALAMASEHRIVGIPEVHKDELISALNQVQSLQEEGAVTISRKENSLLGLMALAVIVVLGLVALLFFLGAELTTQWDFSEASWRNWDVWVFLVIWLDYIAAMLQAIASGEPVIKGMTKWPLVRYISPLGRKITRLTIRAKGQDHAE